MSRQFTFSLTIEVEEDEVVNLDKLDEMLAEMEEICGREGFSMFDAEVKEEE